MVVVTVVDACGGNLTSLVEALRRAGGEPRLSSDPEEVRRAERVILPGVGSAGDCLERLERAGLMPVLRERERPLLGICIGMQLLFEGSDEGGGPALGRWPGRVQKLVARPEARVPHMGWNRVRRRPGMGRDSRLLRGLADGTPFYFVHSYVAPEGPWVVAVADHGGAIPAIVEEGALLGIQCHPEKSQGPGIQLLRNFLELC